VGLAKGPKSIAISISPPSAAAIDGDAILSPPLVGQDGQTAAGRARWAGTPWRQRRPWNRPFWGPFGDDGVLGHEGNAKEALGGDPGAGLSVVVVPSLATVGERSSETRAETRRRCGRSAREKAAAAFAFAASVALGDGGGATRNRTPEVDRRTERAPPRPALHAAGWRGGVEEEWREEIVLAAVGQWRPPWARNAPLALPAALATAPFPIANANAVRETINSTSLDGVSALGWREREGIGREGKGGRIEATIAVIPEPVRVPKAAVPKAGQKGKFSDMMQYSASQPE